MEKVTKNSNPFSLVVTAESVDEAWGLAWDSTSHCIQRFPHRELESRGKYLFLMSDASAAEIKDIVGGLG